MHVDDVLNDALMSVLCNHCIWHARCSTDSLYVYRDGVLEPLLW